MYIKFKFTKKSHVCCKNNHTRVSCPCERPKNIAPRPCERRLLPANAPCPYKRPHAPANAPFTKYLDIHSFNSYTFDREQQKF